MTSNLSLNLRGGKKGGGKGIFYADSRIQEVNTWTKAERGRDLRVRIVFSTDAERGRASTNCWRRFGLRNSEGGDCCKGGRGGNPAKTK